MKKILPIFLCLFSCLGCLQIDAQTRDTLSIPSQKETVKYKWAMVYDTIYIKETVYLKDTIYLPEPKPTADSTRIIYTKPVGRYDRGITNYRFISKHKWIGGVTVSVYNFESDNSRLLFSLLKDINLDLRAVSVKPFIGYAVTDNTVVGLKFGYTRLSGGVDNLALNIEDMDIALKNIWYTNDSYSFNAFHRSYVGLDPKGIFALFNETTLGYATGSSRFSQGTDENLKYTDTFNHQLHIGINPGIALFIMPNVGAEISFGVAGFNYSWEKQKKSSGETGERRHSGANFKINLFNINIGITVCI